MATKRLFALLAVAVIAAGCSGSKGDAGPAGLKGDKGDPGNPGPAAVSEVELCAGCHATALGDKHALSDQLGLVVSDPVIATSATRPNDLVFTFTIKVNGVARFDFGTKAAVPRSHVEDAWWVWDAASVAGVRTKIQPADWDILSTAQSGKVTVILKNLAASAAPGNAYMVSLMNPSGVTATAVGYFPGTRAHHVVADQACIACHGRLVWRDAVHDVTYPQGVGPCIICHNRVGSADPRLPGKGTGLMGIVHGIHNSKNMSEGMNVDIDPSAASTVKNANPDGTYTFTWTNGNKFSFSVGFPNFMNDCGTCHTNPATGTLFAGIANAPVSWALCMSCHNDWNGFVKTREGGAQASHRTLNLGTDCAFCHNPSGFAAELLTVSDAHNGLKTERAGAIWDGLDQSVVYGKRVKMEIAGVDAVGTGTIAVRWTATADLDGDGTFTAVDPCNQDVAAAPVFLGTVAKPTGQVAHNMSMIRSYALVPGTDDWVGGPRTANSPGQPGSVSLDPVNVGTNGYTSCASNVATTILRKDTVPATVTRGIVGLQGKPQIHFDPAVGTSVEVFQVRAVSPTYTFNPQTLGAVAARRTIVSNDKCLACHRGSLYQHGGNRVDNVALCDMCHDPAANEGNNRVAMGVTAAEAYDGKTGEAYDMRNMTHAIHSAGPREGGGSGAPLVYYRSNGIYFFGTKEALNAIADKWPPLADPTTIITCQGSEGVSTYHKVYGAGATGTVPEADTNGKCKDSRVLANSTDGTWRIHNFIEVHYPQPLNNCGACHADGWTPSLPDARTAVAMTFDPGVTATTAPNTLGDDVLIGASAASCMSCHSSGNTWTQWGLREHAYSNGWTPTTFTNGRQTIIDAAK